MSEQLSIIPQNEEQLPEIKSIISLAKQYQPKLEKGNEIAVSEMKVFLDKGVIKNEEEREEAADTIIAVRGTYTKMKTMRMELTKPLDDLKAKWMDYERPLSESDKDSDYNKLRALIGAFDQKKIEEKKRVEAEAAKKKLRANHLVDIGTTILQNLNNLLLTKTTEAETKSAAYFEKSTLEDFDKRAEEYRKMKPSLKTDEYSRCFMVDYNKELFTTTEFADIISTTKKVETYEKWNEQVIVACTPIVNAWRAKIPELKTNLLQLKNASDQAERDRLAQEQRAKAEAEAERRRSEAERQAVAQSMEIQSKADLDKLNNDFVAQATTQAVGDTGPVKYVLKFTDPAQTLKAFTTIIVHCMSHKDFPGVKKKGEEKYITPVQWWIDFFLKNCDVDVAGTEVTEEAKVIIRK